jgi:hypothetical protein
VFFQSPYQYTYTRYVGSGDYFGGPAYYHGYSYFDSYGGEVYAFDASRGGQPFKLSAFGGTNADTSIRRITHLQPNRAGTRLAMVTNINSTVSYYPNDGTKQRPYLISNISTDAGTGALNSSPTIAALESADGRLSNSMAMDSTDSKFYYAFAGATSTEAGMVLTEKTFSAAGAVTNTRTSNGYSGTTARFSVLWSGR